MGGVVLVLAAREADPVFTEFSRPIAASPASTAAAAALGVVAVVLVVLVAIRYGRRRSDVVVREPVREPEPEEDDAASGADTAVVDDAERIELLLEEHGGRMHQSAIVEETGWSKSKVSMILSDMEDDDEISKLRIGRENLINLPGHEPDAVGSPHDE